MSWIRRKLWLLAAAVLPSLATGCNPFTLGFLTPIPVQPWVAERMEEKYNHKNDGRVPIMPPIRDGYPAADLRGPAQRRGSPAGHAPRAPRRARTSTRVPRRHRDRQEPARGQDRPAAVLPARRPGPAAPLPLGMRDLLHRDGPVRLPVPDSTSKKQRVQVIYIDKDHLHLYVGPEPGRAAADHAAT